MAGTVETLAALDGDLKVVYGKTLIAVLPDGAILQKSHPMETGGDYPAVGDFLSALVQLQYPQGLSFLGTGVEGTATNEDLGDALAGQTKPAEVYPVGMVLIDNLSYFVLDRAAKQGQQAVLSAMSLTGTAMATQARNVLELQALHGRQGLGAASANIATLTVTLDPATTSAGILSIMKGARMQFFQSNLTTARTAHDNSNYLTVASVDVSNAAAPTITFTATGTTGVANIVTGDVMFWGGSRGISVASGAVSVPYYEQVGLGLQLSATTGIQFAIDKGVYDGFKANQLPTIGQFSPSSLMSAAALSLGRGGKLGEYEAIVSPRQWSVLSSALATNEVYDKQGEYSMSKKTGTDEITVYHGGIRISVIQHPFQKDGQFYLYPKVELKRLGSTDLTFQLPGKASEEYFQGLPGKAVMQRQCRADWQMILLTPPSGTIGTGITF